MAFDCAIYTQTGRSPGNSSLGLGQLQTSNDSHDLVKNVLWRNSAPLTASSWAILALTFFRQGISRKWRSLGFDHDVFRLMVTMRGASSRLKLLGYLNEPRHKAARYHHVLVDEFQDTSRAQWRLVSLLVKSWGEGAGLAGGVLPPSIFVVGDRKQSIYGFRDADANSIKMGSEVASIDISDAVKK